MRRFRDAPIKQKLVAIGVLTSGVALLLAGSILLVYERTASRAEQIERMIGTARVLGDNSVAALSFDDPSSAEQTLKSLQVHVDVVGAAIYDRSGAVFAVYRNGADESASAFSPVPAEPDGYRFGRNSLEMFRSIELSGEKIGSIYIRADLREMRERLWRLTGVILLVLMLGSLIAYLLSEKLLAPILGRILHLADIVGEVTADKDYSVRATKQGEDELGRLIDGFNEMLNQIQSRDGALQHARDDLEAEVGRRTAELQQAYARLEQQLTEQAAIESSLRESEERFRLSFDSSAIGMAIVSLEGIWLKVNPAMCGMVGYTAAEMQATDFQSLTHPDDLEEDVASARKLAAGETTSYQMEKRYFHKDGHLVWARLSVAIARSATGKALHFIAHIENITERKRGEQALADSETRLRTLIENSSDVIAVTAIDGRLLYVSSSVSKIAGYTTEELIGRKFSDLVHPDDQALAAAQFGELIRQPPGSVQRVERRYRRKDGSWIEAENIAVNLLHLPAVGGIVTTMRDISERRRAEAELEQTHRQLLEASRLGGMAEVATNVLHNVGNVLNSVNVSASLVIESIKTSRADGLAKVVTMLREHQDDLAVYLSDDPKGRHVPAFLGEVSESWLAQQRTVIKELESLRANIDHIKEIVAMQQNYAKAAGTAEIVDVAALIEDSLRMNADSLTRHRVSIVRDFADLPPISVEKHRLLQILVNLVRNAKHACTEHGQTGKCITVRAERVDGRLRITVSDNGIGIAPENLTRIFAHGFTTRKDGHGFGLHSGALAAVELGGSLSVHSDGHGHGATFILDLPLQPPTARS